MVNQSSLLCLDWGGGVSTPTPQTHVQLPRRVKSNMTREKPRLHAPASSISRLISECLSRFHTWRQQSILSTVSAIEERVSSWAHSTLRLKRPFGEFCHNYHDLCCLHTPDVTDVGTQQTAWQNKTTRPCIALTGTEIFSGGQSQKTRAFSSRFLLSLCIHLHSKRGSSHCKYQHPVTRTPQTNHCVSRVQKLWIWHTDQHAKCLSWYAALNGRLSREVFTLNTEVLSVQERNRSANKVMKSTFVDTSTLHFRLPSWYRIPRLQFLVTRQNCRNTNVKTWSRIASHEKGTFWPRNYGRRGKPSCLLNSSQSLTS